MESPEFLNYSPADIVKMGKEQGLPPQQIATGLLNHRRTLEEWGRANAEGDAYFKGAVRVDHDTEDALATLRTEAQAAELQTALPNPEHRAAFAKQYQERGGVKDKLDLDFQQAYDRLIKAGEPFRLPLERWYGGKVDAGGVTLADYAMRKASDDQMDVSLQIRDPRDPAKTTPALLRVPAASQTDVESEAKRLRDEHAATADRRAELQQWLDGYVKQNAKDPANAAVELRNDYGFQRMTKDLEELNRPAAEADVIERGGIRELMRRRILEELRKPEWRGQVGQYDGWAEFNKGLESAQIGAAALFARIAEATGIEDKSTVDATMQMLSELQSSQNARLGGSTRRELEGGVWNDAVTAAQQSAGQMAPMLAGGVATRLGTSALAAPGTAAAAELAAQQAGRVGVAGAGLSTTATGSAYLDTAAQLRAAMERGDAAEVARLQEGRDLHAWLTGLAEGAVERLGAASALNVAGRGVKKLASELGQEAVEEPLTGLLQRGVIDPMTLSHTPDVLAPLPMEALSGILSGAPMVGAAAAMPSASQPESRMAQEAADVVAARELTRAMRLSKQPATPPESAAATASPTSATAAVDGGGVQRSAAAGASGRPVTSTAFASDLDFSRMTPDEAREAATFADQIGADVPGAIAAYRQRFGNHISADNARSLYAPWDESRENRQRLSGALGVPGGKLAQLVFDDAVSRTEEGVVLFLAGGQGSGKTTAVSPDARAAADVVYDNTMSHPQRAEANIRKALANNNAVSLHFVYRPLDEAVHGAIVRANSENGRIERPVQMAATHRASQQTFLKMVELFGADPRVNIEITDATGVTPKSGTAKPMSLAQFKQRVYQQPVEELQKLANNAAREHFEQQPAAYSPEFQARILDAASQGPASNAARRAEPTNAPASSSEGNGGPGASSLKEWGKTTFGQRLKTDERLRKAWRDTIGGQYRIESEAEWQETANRFIQENGPAEAFALMTDPESGLADSDRVAIGLQLILTLDARIRELEAAGDVQGAADLDDLLYETAEWVESRGTKLGQAVRVFGMWTRMSAEGVLRAFERQVAQARQDDLQKRLGMDPDKLAADITTTTAEEHADTAAEALGETTAEQLAELRQQVAELRQQLAQANQEASAAQQEAAQAPTPADAAQASQNVRKAEAKRKQAQRALTAAEAAQQRKASEAGKPRPASQRKPRVLNPEEMAAKLIARLAQTPGQREARRKQSVNEVKKLAEDYTAGRIDSPALQAALEALGVEPDTSARLLQLLDVERAARQSTAANSAPPKRQPGDASSLAWQWIDRLTFRHLIGGPPEPARAAGALAQLIRAYIKAPDAASLPDFNAEARALGLPPAEAVELQRMLDIERATIAQIARDRAINRLVNQLAPKLPKTRERMPRFLKKLFEAHELGALDRPDFLKAYAEAFDLPVMDDETRKRIKLLIDAQRAAPEGYLKQQATTELMGELSKFKGIPALDIFTAFWYANVLSGLTTQGVNVFGNASHLMLKTLTVGATHNPRETWQFMRGLYEGARRGAAEAKAALKEGSVPYRTELNFTQGQVLELIHSNDPGTWARFKNLASLGKWVFRALQAGDAFFYHTAREGRAWLEAARYARTQQAINGGDFGQYMAEQLGNGPAQIQAAIAQAKAELAPSGRDTSFGHVDRRAWEIIEANRPADLNQKASRFGTLTTFTQEPEGTMGAIAGLINEAHRRLSIPSPWGPIRVLTPFIPFVNIVANVTSTALDFTPVGIARGLMGRHVRNTLDRSQKDFDAWESRQRIASGLLGTLGTGMLLAFAMAFRERDDDEVPFMIYGMGPGTKARRDQMPKGWKPYTLKIGDTYLSYAETPLSLVLAIAGGAMDYLRYNPKGREDHAMGAMAYALSTSPQALLKTGVLSSLNDLFSLMEGERSWTQVGTRTASGFIPGQALLRDISELFEGDKIDDTTLAAGLLKDVPFVRGIVGKPALNVFGEPVQLDTLQRLPILKRLVTRQGEDKDTLWMARNKLWMPGIDNQVELGTYLTEVDKQRTQGAGWREDRVRQLGRAAADVLTTEERYRLVQLSGPGLREAIEETRKLKDQFPEITRDQLQERLNAKIVAHRRLAMKRVLGL